MYCQLRGGAWSVRFTMQLSAKPIVFIAVCVLSMGVKARIQHSTAEVLAFRRAKLKGIRTD